MSIPEYCVGCRFDEVIWSSQSVKYLCASLGLAWRDRLQLWCRYVVLRFAISCRGLLLFESCGVRHLVYISQPSLHLLHISLALATRRNLCAVKVLLYSHQKGLPRDRGTHGLKSNQANQPLWQINLANRPNSYLASHSPLLTEERSAIWCPC